MTASAPAATGAAAQNSAAPASPPPISAPVTPPSDSSSDQSPPPVDANIAPRLKFEVGQTRLFYFTQSESWAATITGIESLGLTLVEKGYATETVKAVRSTDGAGTLVVRLHSISLNANGGPVSSHSVLNSLSDQTGTFLVTPTGAIISSKTTGSSPSDYLFTLRYFAPRLFSCSAGFPRGSVPIGGSWSSPMQERAGVKASGTSEGTLMDVKNYDGKQVAFFHYGYSETSQGRGLSTADLNSAFGGAMDGYADESFNLNGGYLRDASGMVHVNANYSFALTQNALDNGMYLKSSTGNVDVTLFYTVDLLKVK